MTSFVTCWLSMNVKRRSQNMAIGSSGWSPTPLNWKYTPASAGRYSNQYAAALLRILTPTLKFRATRDHIPGTRRAAHSRHRAPAG